MGAPSVSPPRTSTKWSSHLLDGIRHFHTQFEFPLGWLPTRVPRQLDRGIIVMQRRKPIIVRVHPQKRKYETEVMEHAVVGFPGRMSGYYEVYQGIWKTWDESENGEDRTADYRAYLSQVLCPTMSCETVYLHTSYLRS